MSPTGKTWTIKIRPAPHDEGMPDSFCRACGAEMKAIAVCIGCGKSVLYGCPRCATFLITEVHIDCLELVIQE